MFTAKFREQVYQRIVALARADPRVTGAALTGSTALDKHDRWSDLDVAFGIADGHSPAQVVADWTQALDREIGLVAQFDMHASPRRVSRVLLLPGGLEVDLVVVAADELGAYGPKFRALFGTTVALEPQPQPEPAYLVGMGWLHVLHARAFIERNRLWQAEYFIRGIRDHTLALACLRLGEDARYGVGADRLPAAVAEPLAAALVRSLDPPELRRALAAATRCLVQELEQRDRHLCARLTPLLLEYGAPEA